MQFIDLDKEKSRSISTNLATRTAINPQAQRLEETRSSQTMHQDINLEYSEATKGRGRELAQKR